MNTKVWGIAAMICGILSLFIPFIGFFLALFALIVGIITLTKQHKQATTKKGFAIAGIVLGITGLFLSIISLGAFAYFGVLDTSKFIPESCILDEQLTCVNHTVINESSLLLDIQNNLNRTITITRVTLDDGIPCVELTNVPIPSKKDSNVNLSFNNCHFDSNSHSVYDVTIEYLPESSSINHVANGRLIIT